MSDQTADWTNQLPTCQPIYTTIQTPTPTTSSGIGTTASLVVIGGMQGVYPWVVSSNTVDIYQLNSGSITWSHQGSPSPYGWARAGWAVDNGNIYVLGGWLYDVPSRIQYGAAKYSVEDNRWEQLPSITWKTHNGPVVFIHRDTLYSADGDGWPGVHEVWSLDLTNVNGVANGWIQENNKLPYSVTGPKSVTSVGDRVLIIGKFLEASTSVASWRPGTTEAWTPGSDMNVARYQVRLCSVTDGVDRIWVMAGCEDCWPQGFMEMYQVSTDTWTTLNAVPDLTFPSKDGIWAQICGYHDGYIYAVFSQSWNSGLDQRFHIFDTLDNTWSVSQTQLRREAYRPSAAVAP